MRSHLLVGSVHHRRTRPAKYALKHDVFYFALDLEELSDLDDRLWAFGYNRANVFSLRDSDHFPRAGQTLASAVRERLADRGLPADELRTTLVTNARVLGYVFNPVSFYLSHDRSGALRHVIAEVHNTHGDRHVYDLEPADPARPVFRSQAVKELYVSPFIGMDARYEFQCASHEHSLSVSIDEFEGVDHTLRASLALRRRPLTNRSLAAMFARYPLITLKTIGAIHWHGLRLWLRGVPFHPYQRTEVER